METVGKTRCRIQVATASDVAELVRMQLALQRSIAGVGRKILHLHHSSTVRLHDYYAQQITDEQARVLIVRGSPSEQAVAMGSGRIWVHADYVPARSGELIDLWVEPEHRRQGWARRLVSRLLRFFRANRIEFLAVNHMHGQSAAEAFWRKLGFESVLVTATAERRAVEAALGVTPQRIVPVGYRLMVEEPPTYTRMSRSG